MKSYNIKRLQVFGKLWNAILRRKISFVNTYLQRCKLCQTFTFKRISWRERLSQAATDKGESFLWLVFEVNYFLAYFVSVTVFCKLSFWCVKHKMLSVVNALLLVFTVYNPPMSLHRIRIESTNVMNCHWVQLARTKNLVLHQLLQPLTFIELLDWLFLAISKWEHIGFVL